MIVTSRPTECAFEFEFWQMKLGFAELSEKTNLQSEALPLFTFDTGEQVSFWTAPSIQTVSTSFGQKKNLHKVLRARSPQTDTFSPATGSLGGLEFSQICLWETREVEPLKSGRLQRMVEL